MQANLCHNENAQKLLWPLERPFLATNINQFVAYLNIFTCHFDVLKAKFFYEIDYGK